MYNIIYWKYWYLSEDCILALHNIIKNKVVRTKS